MDVVDGGRADQGSDGRYNMVSSRNSQPAKLVADKLEVVAANENVTAAQDYLFSNFATTKN